MGNAKSIIIEGGQNEIVGQNAENNKTLLETVDYIASNYILTMDFQNLRKMYDKEHCDNLIHVTSKILDTYFSSKEIRALYGRIEKDNTSLENSTSLEKSSMCNDIAKFYIKIAHLFSAILLTLNPEYVYTDSTGKVIKRKITEKDQIPSDMIVDKINTGFCESRIRALSRGESNLLKNNNGKEQEDGKEIQEPSVCSTNIYSREKEGNVKEDVLAEEPGIPELMDLYYDSGYDVKTGEFKGMSAETEDIFKKDLHNFYKTFTQNEIVPDTIRSFSDIKLKDYSQTSVCKNKKNDSENYKTELLTAYADNLKQMLRSVNEKQQQLLETINVMFEYDKEKIRIHPDLTSEILQELIVDTRSVIVELYLHCEKDFLKGVHLYEAIVESLIIQSTQEQLKTLDKEVEKLYEPFT